jgi:ribosomal-protein-serine acetyltransferase
MHHSITTSLTDGTFELRPFNAHDEQSLFEAIAESLPQLCTWLTWCRPEHALANCTEFILKCRTDWQAGEQFNFGIFRQTTGEFLGSIAINHINRAHNMANIGYWVRTSKTGQGIATASVKLITKFGFVTLGLTRLEIVVPMGNEASQRTAIKSGARLEGCLRDRLILSGKLNDANLYSLLPADLR